MHANVYSLGQCHGYRGQRFQKARCCEVPGLYRRAKGPPLQPFVTVAHAGPTEASTGGALPGSTRRVRVSRHAAALEVLRRVTYQAQIPLPTPLVEPDPEEGLVLRFPALEFRSLLLNAIGRSSFPDRAVWKRYKVELCWLLLHLAGGDLHAYTQDLDALVADCIDHRERSQQGGRAQTRAQRLARRLHGQALEPRQRLNPAEAAAAVSAAAGGGVDEGAAAEATRSVGYDSSSADYDSSRVDYGSNSVEFGSFDGGSGGDSCWGSPLCSRDDADLPSTQTQVLSTAETNQVQDKFRSQVALAQSLDDDARASVAASGRVEASAAACRSPPTSTTTGAPEQPLADTVCPGGPPSAPYAASLPPSSHRKRHLRAQRSALRSRIDAWCRATVGFRSEPVAAAATAAGQASAAGDSDSDSIGDASPSGSASACSGGGAAATVVAAAGDGCRGSGGGSAFATLRPILEQVMLLGEPAPLVDNRRNGSLTELQVASLMESELPEGWQLLSQATFMRVDGAPFPARKHLKGEADLLLVDPEGVVQALVEVKTAKGNPIVALYEDVDKLLGLLRVVRKRTVTVRHGTTTPQRVSTLAFSSRLRPIYVLGCGGAGLGLGLPESDKQQQPQHSKHEAWHQPQRDVAPGGATAPSGPAPGGVAAAATAVPDGIRSHPSSLPSGLPAFPSPAVLRTAWAKLLTMELGRELSAEAASWSAVSVTRLSREAVVLQVRRDAYEPLVRRVAAYFTRLAHCGVFLAETSS